MQNYKERLKLSIKNGYMAERAKRPLSELRSKLGYLKNQYALYGRVEFMVKYKELFF